MPKQQGEYGTYTCPVCDSLFARRLSSVRTSLKKSKSGPYCSKSCAARISYLIRKGV